MNRPRRTRNALEIVDRMIGDDVELRATIDEEVMNAELAMLLRTARKAAGLSQSELATLVGTSQPSVARLEAAEYEGHSLTMLRRIAAVLRRRIEIRFLPTSGDSGA